MIFWTFQLTLFYSEFQLSTGKLLWKHQYIVLGNDIYPSNELLNKLMVLFFLSTGWHNWAKMTFTFRMIEFIDFLNKHFLLVTPATQYRRLVSKAKKKLFAKLDYFVSIKTKKKLKYKFLKTFVETKDFKYFLITFFIPNTFVRKSNQKAQNLNISCKKSTLEVVDLYSIVGWQAVINSFPCLKIK